MILILQDCRLRTDIRSEFDFCKDFGNKNLIYFKLIFLVFCVWFFFVFPPEFDILITPSGVSMAKNPQVAVSGCSYIEVPKLVMTSNSNS